MLQSAVAFALLLGGPASAAVLTWDDAVATARRQNPDLNAARRAEEAGRADYRGSFNAFLPKVDLSGTRNESKDQSASTRWSAEAGVSLNVFHMGRVADIRDSKAALARATAARRQTGADLRFDLRVAFLDLLVAQESREVSRRIADIRRRGAELVTLRYRTGRESKGSMMRASAQSLQAQADLAQSGRELRTAQRTLGRRLGLDAFEALVATGSLAAAAPPGLPQRLDEIAARRPDLAATEALLRSAEANAASARGALWPNLAGRYSRSSTGPTAFPRDDWSWTAGATLSLPLLAGGPTAAYQGIVSANRGVERARENLRAARAQALVDLEENWASFARAAAQAQVSAALLEAARQRSEEADVRYASGLLSYDNWEIITSDRVSQERQELQARLGAATTEAGWERAQGKDLGE